MSRAQAQDLAVQHGAKVTGSVTTKTDLLIVGSGSATRSKLVKALHLGVETTTADEFLTLR